MKDRGQVRTETVQRFGRQPRTAPAVQAVLAMASAELAKRLVKEHGAQVMAMAGVELAKRLVNEPGLNDAGCVELAERLAEKNGGVLPGLSRLQRAKAWETMKARESGMSEPELALHLAKRLVANGTPGTGAAKAGGATQSKGHRAAKKAWATMKARESKMSEPELARLHRKRSMAAKKAWVTIRAKTA